MKEIITELIKKHTKLKTEEIESLIEIPPSQELGDFSFPCFKLSQELKSSPQSISQEIEKKIKFPKEIEKIESKGPYLNFFLNKKILAENTASLILKQGENYGKSKEGKEKANAHRAYPLNNPWRFSNEDL